MKKILLFAFLLIASHLSHANVIIFDMDPNDLGLYDDILYDINNDGKYDFRITCFSSSGNTYGLKIKGLNGLQVETDGNLNLIGYNFNTMVGVNSYQDSGYVTTSYFPDATNRCIGFKFNIAGESKCGYLGIVPSYRTSFYVYSGGYETNSGQCIIAGAAATVGIENTKNEPKHFTLQQKDEILSINSDGANANTVKIYDITGRMVFESSPAAQHEIATKDLPKSMVFVVVTEASKPSHSNTFKIIIR